MRSAIGTKVARVKGSNNSQFGDDDSKEAGVSDLGERSHRESERVRERKNFLKLKEPKCFFNFKIWVVWSVHTS